MRYTIKEITPTSGGNIMAKKKLGKDKDWLEKEDWKITAWDKDGKLLIRDGKPTKLLNKRKK